MTIMIKAAHRGILRPIEDAANTHKHYIGGAGFVTYPNGPECEECVRGTMVWRIIEGARFDFTHLQPDPEPARLW